VQRKSTKALTDRRSLLSAANVAGGLHHQHLLEVSECVIGVSRAREPEPVVTDNVVGWWTSRVSTTVSRELAHSYAHALRLAFVILPSPRRQEHWWKASR
jgi:hypothetical protein